MLFEDKKRTFYGPQSYNEDDYGYLNRSGRIEADRIRKFIDKWIKEYPEEERDELVARIKDRRHFKSATFELTVFAILKKLGCSVKVHPELKNNRKSRPDFLVNSPDGDQFYLEAVIASEYDKAQAAAEQRKNVVLSSINQVDSPDFLIGIDTEGNPKTPPPGKKLRGDLKRWLSSLDPDVVIQEVDANGFDCFPSYKWIHDGWQIIFQAIPKKIEKRAGGEGGICFIAEESRYLNTSGALRNAVKNKGNHYGEIDRPLLIAVNVDSISVEKIDEMNALYGQLQAVVDIKNPEAEAETRRVPNGAWYGKKGPQYTRVSGVWVFDSLNTWNISRKSNTVYLNPWADKKLPDIILELNHAKALENNIQRVKGKSLGNILDLPDNWPE